VAEKLSVQSIDRETDILHKTKQEGAH
jgi:hypothetical protein